MEVRRFGLQPRCIEALLLPFRHGFLVVGAVAEDFVDLVEIGRRLALLLRLLSLQ